MAHARPPPARPGPTGLGSAPSPCLSAAQSPPRGRAGAAAGPPPAGSAGEVPAELALRTGPAKPSGLVDRAIHLSVLKELLGPEIRDIIRAELASLLVSSPDSLANLSRRPSNTKGYGADGAPAAAAGSARPLGSGARTGKDEDGWRCNTQCHSYLYEEAEDMGDTETEDETEECVVASVRKAPGGRPAPPTVAVVSDDAKGGMAKPLLPAVDRAHPLVGAYTNARTVMSSDMADTGKYLYDISGSETDSLETTERAAQARIQSHWLAAQFPWLATCIFRVDGIVAQIGTESMEAPEPSNSLSQIADSCWFQTAGNVVTVLNCAFLTYMADWNFKNYSRMTPRIVCYIDNAFLGFFTLELAGRLARHQLYYFVNPNYLMNWIDFVIVVSGCIEFAFDAMAGSMSFLRQLRALRLLKVLRLFRVLRMFRTLQVVFDSLANTLTELIWCAVTLLLIEYMFALMIVMRIGTFLREDGGTLTNEQILNLTEKFGSISSAVMSLFVVSMGASDWSIHYDILSPTGLTTQVIYLVFVVFSFIAVLNVILGIFVEKAMKNLAPTREEQAQQHAAEEMEMVNDVKALCLEGDVDSDGKLCKEEWEDIFAQGKIAAYMDGKGFRSHDLRAYFDFCAIHSNGEIDIEAFVRGCCRLKGPASCFDVKTVLAELHWILERMQEKLAHPRDGPVAAG